MGRQSLDSDPQIVGRNRILMTECEQLAQDYQSLQDWTRLVATVTLKIRKSLDLCTILQTTVDEVHSLLECDRVFIYKFQPDWSGQVLVESVSDPQWSLLDRVVHDSCFQSSWLEPYFAKRYYAVNNINESDLSPCHREFLQGFQVQASLVMPILVEDHLWGLLIAHHCCAPRHWLNIEIDGLQQLAEHLGIAIQQASLIEQLQAANDELTSDHQAIAHLLQQSQDQVHQFAAIVESMQDAVLSATIDGTITCWNPAAQQLFGYAPSEIIGESVAKLVPEDYQAEARQLFQRIHDGQNIDAYETQRCCKDGTLVDVSLTLAAIRDEMNQVVGVSAIVRDIRDRQREEQQRSQFMNQLQEQASILQAFYDTAPLMMGMVELSDNDVLLTVYNPATKSLFRKYPADITNTWASKLGFTDDQIQLWLSHYRQSQQSQRPVQFDYEHTQDDTRAWLLVTVTFLGMADSQRPKCSFIIQDISDRKRLEQEREQAFGLLHESEQRYASLVAAAPVGIFRADATGNCSYVNDGWSQIAGLSLEEALGTGWVQSLHPEDRDYVTQEWHCAAQEQRPFQLEYRFQRPDGQTTWVYGRAIAEYDLEQQVLGYVGTITDISDRKAVEVARSQAQQVQSELNLLEQILEIVLAGYWDWDISNNAEYLSPRFKQMFGYDDHELPNSPETWQNLIFPEDLPGVFDQFERHVSSHGIDPYYNEVRYRHKDGSTVWVICSGQVIEWDTEGNPLRMIGCHIDITRLKEVEENLRKSEVTNRALIQAIPDFLVRMNRDGQQMEVINEGAVHCLHPGKRIQDIDGIFVSQIMPLAIAQDRIKLAQLALETGKIQQQEYQFDDNGQTYYEEARITPLWDDDVLVVVRDISDRKQAERKLAAANDQLKLVIQASSEGFWDWDLVTGEIYFSRRWKEMLGYADDELENTFDTWKRLIFNDDRDTTLQLIDDYNNGKVENFTITQRFHHKNGSTVYVLSRAIHLNDAQGTVVRMIGSHLDITSTVEMQAALKMSEMKLGGILNSSLDGIMAFRSIRNDKGAIVDFEWILSNSTACNIVGKSASQLIGQRLLEEMPGNREEGLFDLYVQVVETGEPARHQFYYNQDGLDYWFENISVKLGDGFVVTFRNITELKQSEQALQQANQQLKDHIEDLKQRNEEMVLLSETSDFLQACLTIEEACAVITSLVEPLFPGCSGGIFITSASRNRVENVATWGQALNSTADFYPHDCWALRRGRLHSVGQHRSGLRCNHITNRHTVSDTLCIPMIAQGETLGLFYLSAEIPTTLSNSKQQLARTVAEQVALAIANLHLRETLQNQSIRDPLTGLFNRRYLEESLQREILRAQRHQHPISVIMLDIDHFKRFNDTYGHDAGDYVLQAVGALLRDNVRGSDIACRYGGEEMTIVLPDLPLVEAGDRAEHIRTLISQVRLNHNGKLLDPITTSLGVATFPQQGVTGSAVIQAADAALYRAKAAGRNQVVLSP